MLSKNLLGDDVKHFSTDCVTDLIGDLDELALGEVTVFVFGVAVVLEHLQDDFVLAGRRVGVLVIGIRAGGT